ncbi:MAG: class I lanthipeptide [Spirosomataceae bacterium]
MKKNISKLALKTDKIVSLSIEKMQGVVGAAKGVTGGHTCHGGSYYVCCQ